MGQSFPTSQWPGSFFTWHVYFIQYEQILLGVRTQFHRHFLPHMVLNDHLTEGKGLRRRLQNYPHVLGRVGSVSHVITLPVLPGFALNHYMVLLTNDRQQTLAQGIPIPVNFSLHNLCNKRHLIWTLRSIFTRRPAYSLTVFLFLNERKTKPDLQSECLIDEYKTLHRCTVIVLHRSLFVSFWFCQNPTYVGPLFNKNMQVVKECLCWALRRSFVDRGAMLFLLFWNLGWAVFQFL